MHLKETVARTGVYKVMALTKYGDGDMRSIPSYSPEKGDADKGPSTGTVEHRFPCSLGYSKQK